MESVKKKMSNLKMSLDEAEEKASKAEAELKEANDRADAVSCHLLLCYSSTFSPLVHEYVDYTACLDYTKGLC